MMTPRVRQILAELRDRPLTDEQHAMRDRLADEFAPAFAEWSRADLEWAFIEALCTAAELLAVKATLDVH